MTIITGSQFRANQGKYIGMVNRGERVILSSKSGYTELKPVAEDDKEIQDYMDSKCLMTVASRARRELKEGNTISLKSHKDVDNYFNSL